MDRLDIILGKETKIAVKRFFDLTGNKIKQLREREEAVQGSNQAIQETHERDIQEIRAELQRQYKYINERG